MGTTNLNDLVVDSLVMGGFSITPTTQALTADGAITIKEGVATLDKTSPLLATLANPIATTDDHKRLTIVSLSAQAHTITCTGGFGNAGTGEDVATFTAAIGACLDLIAFQGYWYVAGQHLTTIA
jgi:hypothetical protein